jgi:hypothetical protein
MPITLSCPCGKTLRVADEHAGKRVKCPVCTAVLTAPKAEPEPQFEVIEEQPANALVAPKPVVKPKAVEEDDEDERGGYGLKPAEKTAPIPTPEPEFRRRAEADEDDDRPRKKKKKKQRREAREAGEEAGQRVAYTLGGGFGALLGSGLAIWGSSNDGRHGTKMLVFGIIIGLCGLVSLIQGLTGEIPDDESSE